jgi:3-oxoacyl-[acyl-carrier-protein] synthase-3
MKKAQIIAAEYIVPAQRLDNQMLAARFPEWPAEKIDAKLGIKSRGIAAEDEFSSDLAVQAAKKLFATRIISPKEIDFLLFCTQSPDYLLPTSACLIQHRLGLPKSCGALDINLGCSGWIYGVGIAKGLIESNQASNVLFVTGETYSKFLGDSDKGTRTLFGDAGAATLISGVESTQNCLGPFIYGTDGSGGEHLIVQQSGMRESARARPGYGELYMNGAEIFSFSVREVSKAVQRLLDQAEITLEEVDLFIFHQANSYMLEFLRQRCNIPTEKFYTFFENTGNTVSNTIPIALHHAMKDGKAVPGKQVMFVGFGVGLSWGAFLARL